MDFGWRENGFCDGTLRVYDRRMGIYHVKLLWWAVAAGKVLKRAVEHILTVQHAMAYMHFNGGDADDVNNWTVQHQKLNEIILSFFEI